MKNGATNVTVSRPRTTGRAFTLIESVAVTVLLAVMAGVALPVYFDLQAQARESAIKGTLGGVRAGIVQFMADQVVNGGGPMYPTLPELTTNGTVMMELLPENPLKGSNTVGLSTPAQAAARATGGADGWRYYVDNLANPPVYVFYSNSSGYGSNVW